MRFFLLSFFLLVSCKKEKLTYKKIETRDYYLEGYTYINNTNKIFPNELVLVGKKSKDTLYHCYNCYNDFHLILQDTLLIYGGAKLDSVINKTIILRRVPTTQNYKYNLPFVNED
jgi:hypothetical protein